MLADKEGLLEYSDATEKLPLSQIFDTLRRVNLRHAIKYVQGLRLVADLNRRRRETGKSSLPYLDATLRDKYAWVLPRFLDEGYEPGYATAYAEIVIMDLLLLDIIDEAVSHCPASL